MLTSCDFEEQTKGCGAFKLRIQAVIHRYYAVHMYRVVGVMAAMALTVLTVFCPGDDVTPIDRLSLALTILLTATA